MAEDSQSIFSGRASRAGKPAAIAIPPLPSSLRNPVFSLSPAAFGSRTTSSSSSSSRYVHCADSNGDNTSGDSTENPLLASDMTKIAIPLESRIKIDVGSAACAVAGLAPFVCIFDKSVVSNASGKQKLGPALAENFTLLFTRPHRFLMLPELWMIYGVYFGTYCSANITDTLCRHHFDISPSFPVFAATTCANMGLGVLKDVTFAKMFGTKAPAKMPRLAYLMFAVRDSLTILSSFTFVPKLGEWVHEQRTGVKVGAHYRGNTVPRMMSPVKSEEKDEKTRSEDTESEEKDPKKKKKPAMSFSGDDEDDGVDEKPMDLSELVVKRSKSQIDTLKGIFDHQDSTGSSKSPADRAAEKLLADFREENRDGSPSAADGLAEAAGLIKKTETGKKIKVNADGSLTEVDDKFDGHLQNDLNEENDDGEDHVITVHDLEQDPNFDRSLKIAQLAGPMLIQVFSTPLHLGGLDLYNRVSPDKKGKLIPVSNRLHKIFLNWDYPKTVLARCARMCPAFGFGGIGNTYFKKTSLERLKQEKHEICEGMVHKAALRKAAKAAGMETAHSGWKEGQGSQGLQITRTRSHL